MNVLGWAIAATVVLHGGAAAWVSTLPEPEEKTPTVITVREAPRKKPLPPPPPPRPAAVTAPVAPVKEQAKPPLKRTAKPPPAAAQQAPTTAAPPPVDTGLKLGNTGDGPSVAPPREQSTEAPKPPTPKTLDVKPEGGGCADPIVKPRPKQVVQPAFTQEARDAGITGKVRVEITISTTGAVTAAKVISGLGHGLDEAALEAARASTFEPASKCGVAIETTFTIGMRFQ